MINTNLTMCLYFDIHFQLVSSLFQGFFCHESMRYSSRTTRCGNNFNLAHFHSLLLMFLTVISSINISISCKSLNPLENAVDDPAAEIGRASCREGGRLSVRGV